MTTKAELACVYSALILVDDDVAVTVSISCVYFMYNVLYENVTFFGIISFNVEYIIGK